MAHDIIDAEFETVRRDAFDATAAPGAPKPVPAQAHDHQIGILKSVEPARPLPGPRMHVAYGLSVLFASVAAFLLAGGHVLLRAAPHAPAEPALQLVSSTNEALPQRGDVLTVQATVRNSGPDARRVPDVLLTFPAADGTTRLVYRVARGETLEPGKSLAFTVRMPKKPGYAQAPSLRFDANGV